MLRRHATRAALRAAAPGGDAAAAALRGAEPWRCGAAPAAARRIHEDRNGEMEELIERTLARALLQLGRRRVLGASVRSAPRTQPPLGLTPPSARMPPRRSSRCRAPRARC
jgi:hypothetical protein